ncbi:MAG: D-alanyl-D-alanine carboxypeptidase family protein [Eubacteriales bacterium]|nr:D-alanyl-D-alanine carboxypeptidase family protein [Eubacteriales bacterium]
MKKLTLLLSLVLLLELLPVQAMAVEIPITSRAALLMEKETGQILYAQNEHEKLEPASVTKIMTLLLTMEAIDAGKLHYDDVVTASANAAAMGGSQVFLKEGEQMTVEDLLKAVCVASGNDACVALAEHISGVTELFVEQMNNRAKELGMNDTHFVNCNGLTAEGHLTSAYDIALMSRELLLHHDDIHRFTTIWMDTIRDGAFQLANTNKLIRFYDGATGLKTGFTSSAGYCISATAEKEGMELIAVIMKGETADSRNTDAKALLNYGFSTYGLVDVKPDEPFAPIPVALGTADTVQPQLGEQGSHLLLPKNQVSELQQSVVVAESLTAPVEKGQKLGELTVSNGTDALVTIPITAAESVPRLTWREMYMRLLHAAFLAG